MRYKIISQFTMMPSQLILQSDQIFDVLVSRPWYNWNLKNRKTLLICMANSINPLSFCFAGMTLDYKLPVTVSGAPCAVKALYIMFCRWRDFPFPTRWVCSS
jgi:hypothetical protein